MPWKKKVIYFIYHFLAHHFNSNFCSDGKEGEESKNEEKSHIDREDIAVPTVTGKKRSAPEFSGDRHEETLAMLIRSKIASDTEPFSKANGDGTYTFTKFLQNVVFGPGSNHNSIYFCGDCNKIYEYLQKGDGDRCVFCQNKNIKRVISTCGCG